MLTRFLFDPLPGIAYNLINILGSVLVAVCVALLAWREYRRRFKLGLRKGQPQLKLAEARHKKGEASWLIPLAIYMLCCVAAYGVLLVGRLIPQFLDQLLGTNKYNHIVAFAPGVLLAIPVLWGLANCFPKNGKPARQLEPAMIGLALNQAFIRTACFLNGCCYGYPSGFGIVFPPMAPSSLEFGQGVRVFPTQPIEAGMMFLCFGAILVLHLRGRRTLPIFPLTFGATGFLLAFMDATSRNGTRDLLLLGLSLMQWSYLLIFIIGLFFLRSTIQENKSRPSKRRHPVK